MPGAGPLNPRDGSEATAITEVPSTHPEVPVTFAKLRRDAVLTTPVNPMSEIVFATTSNSLPKGANGSLPISLNQFSKGDKEIAVYGMWVKRNKISKGEISGSVFDALNHVRVEIPPKRVTLTDAQQIFGFSFSPANLPPGIYRVDWNWDGTPAWRTFIRLTD